MVDLLEFESRWISPVVFETTAANQLRHRSKLNFNILFPIFLPFLLRKKSRIFLLIKFIWLITIFYLLQKFWIWFIDANSTVKTNKIGSDFSFFTFNLCVKPTIEAPIEIFSFDPSHLFTHHYASTDDLVHHNNVLQNSVSHSLKLNPYRQVSYS